jgi:fibronectin-binding autotransporter adhesin
MLAEVPLAGLSLFSAESPAAGLTSPTGWIVAGGDTRGRLLRAGTPMRKIVFLPIFRPIAARTRGWAATLAGVLSDGAGGGVLNLTKTGGGPLRLANAASTYSGPTTIFQGTVVISANDSLGTGVSTVHVGSGGSLFLDGSQTPFTLTRNLSVARNGPIGSSAALVSLAANTITGAVSTSTGTVAWIESVPRAGTLTRSGSLNLNAGLNLNHGHFAITGTVAGSSGTIAIGPASGTTSLQKTGPGTWVLSGANTFTGIPYPLPSR